jgi:iron complex outermembrane receptor protein
VALATALTLASFTAQAQRASENAVTTAADAFGTSIGEDSIGLYNSGDARGFSPKDAGNVRLEGLFYDQQGGFGFGSPLIKRTTMRVGLSAQSYLFPAPTGIADIQLRLPEDETIISISSTYGPYGSSFSGRVDVETPLIINKLGMLVSLGGSQRELNFHGVFNSVDGVALFRLRPSDQFEAITFLQRSQAYDGEASPLIFTGEAFLPPKVDRSVFYGQRAWAVRKNRNQTNAGVLVRSSLWKNWRVTAGVFRSSNNVTNDFQILYRNTQPDGTADLSFRSRPGQKRGSFSGEVRASGVFSEGPRRHTLHVSAKGRSVRLLFGGDDTISFGAAVIGVNTPVPEPSFNIGPQSRDRVRQGNLGASYVGQWASIGEVSVGLQKAFYRRTVNQSARAAATTRSNPWLYNGTLAIYATDDLAFYASFTRGLEDSGIAPENADNPGEALASSLTEQVDAGIRYQIMPGTTLVAGVFEVSKPYFDRDSANLFTRLGSLRHRGIEFSLSGQPLEGLKVVVGAMFLQARVSGFTVDQGIIGSVPPGRAPALIRFNANYGPPAWKGFSVNGKINHEGSHFANRINTLRIPSATALDLGARYDFKLFEALSSLRFDVRNVTNVYIWTVSGSSERYEPLPARRYSMRFVVDF